jgi:cell division septation protein DedD
MTVRYTAIDSMEEAALRDVDRNAERWRDKIEVRLDNRQVFFLFFGSAVVACMLFVLGVMVGKRIESRGQAASPELQDPLAVLDRAHTPVAAVVPAPAPQLTFPNALITSSTAKPAKPVKVASVAAVAAPKPVPVIAPPKPIAPAAVAPQPPRPIAAVAVAPQPPKPIAAAAVATQPPKPIAAAASKIVPPAPKPAVAATTAADAPAGKGKFTLHLSTFASAEEAKAFAQHYPGAFIVAGDVPGRGMAYRVRYGNFATYKDATSAKDSFEKQHNVIALVAAR